MVPCNLQACPAEETEKCSKSGQPSLPALAKTSFWSCSVGHPPCSWGPTPRHHGDPIRLDPPPRKGRAQGGGSTQLSDPHTTRPGLSGALGELLVTSLNPRPQEVHIWVQGQSTAGPEEPLRPTRAWDQAWWSSGTLSPGAVSGRESRQDALWGRGGLDARLPS